MKKSSFAQKFAKLIPIFFILMIVLYSDEMVLFSHTYLGRLCAILLIVFYTTINKLYGILVCALVIFYYQTDVVNSILEFSMDDSIDDELSYQSKNHSLNVSRIVQAQHNTDLYDIHIISDLHDDTEGTMVEMSVEGFTNPLNTTNNKIVELQEKFRKLSCKNGGLVYKNMPVKTDMAEHIFPQIHFQNDQKCNPCDINCSFSIVESKIATQEEIVYPKTSDDWVMNVWEKWFSNDDNGPIPAIGIISEFFSNY